MRRNPLKDGIISEYSFGTGKGTRRMVLTRAEELATIRGDWLHKVSASDSKPGCGSAKLLRKHMNGRLPTSSQIKFMETIEKTIEVDRPVTTVYGLWTQFENFPRFMSGIKEVRQLDEKHLHWKAEIGGKTKEWDAEISEQVPDQRITWSSTSGAENSGTMHFIALSPIKTRIILYLSYGPKGLVERMGNNLGVVSARVASDLNRFKKFTEAQALLSKTVSSPRPEFQRSHESHQHRI